MELAMVGLGRMGLNMARRLARGGHRLAAYNRTREKAEQLAAEESGVSVLSGLEELCRRARAAQSGVAHAAGKGGWTITSNNFAAY